jgi:hypothetical protein
MRAELTGLIESGKLKVGTVLYHRGRRYKDRDVTAKVVSKGIEFRGRVFDNPTAAAGSVVDGAVNGWVFWRIQESDQLLSVLRGGKARPPE